MTPQRNTLDTPKLFCYIMFSNQRKELQTMTASNNPFVTQESRDDNQNDQDHDVFGIGHNSNEDTEDNEDTLGDDEPPYDRAQAILRGAAAMAQAVGAEKAARGKKESSVSFRREAAKDLFPVFNALGLDPEWGKDFAKQCKLHPVYMDIYDTSCRAMSAKLKDPIEEPDYGSTKGVKFSQSVRKMWSRLITSYREGGDGGPTEADKKGHETAKEKANTDTAQNKSNAEKAGRLDSIITAYISGDTIALDALIAAASADFPGS